MVIYVLMFAELEAHETERRFVTLTKYLDNGNRLMARYPHPVKPRVRTVQEFLRIRKHEKELEREQSKAYHRRNYSTIYEPDVGQVRGVILIYSVCVREEAMLRRVIRQTWAIKPVLRQQKMAVVFVLASLSPLLSRSKRGKDDIKELQIEHEQNKDILMFDFIDAYSNLTLKTVNALKWFANTNMSLLIKCDSDVLINWSVILDIMDQSTLVAHDFILGHRLQSDPDRDPDSKWYVPYKVYNQTKYPEFVSGTSYAMTAVAASKILQQYRSLSYLYLEDVFITGLCRAAAKVELVGSESFLMPKDEDTYMMWNKLASVHGYTKSELIEQWVDIKTVGETWHL